MKKSAVLRITFVTLIFMGFAAYLVRKCEQGRASLDAADAPQDVSTDRVEDAGARARTLFAAAVTGIPCADAGIEASVDGGIACKGLCINPYTDNNNCSACGQVCPCGASWNYCENCVSGTCCIALGSTCEFAPAHTCCDGSTCMLAPSGTHTCQ